MSGDSLNNEKVAVDDEEQRQEVDENAVGQDVRSGEHILVQIVSTTGSHVALGHIAVKKEILTKNY